LASQQVTCFKLHVTSTLKIIIPTQQQRNESCFDELLKVWFGEILLIAGELFQE
jgi:hypothetical protein